ncbi:MAG: hypothetical protein BGO95_08680 [Micrococcales bacterium 73-13]|nr:MAG: hypothetical protein BGO95_08680 [Micrococcales bacterium 73-13]
MEVTSFNATWTGLVLVLAGAGVGAHYLLRGRSFAVRRGWLFGLAWLTLGCSAAFHLAYLLDPPPEGFPLLQNLPLHFCTLMSFLMPLVVWFDWKPLRAVAFFPGAIAGIASLVSAASYEQGHPLLDPKSFFWVAHALNAIVPFLLASLGLYRPTWRQALLSVVWVIAFGALVILPLDLAMRAWVDPGVNYFYLFDPEGADILVALRELIPVPILYMLPLPILVIPVMLLQLGIYRLLHRGGPEPAAAVLA